MGEGFVQPRDRLVIAERAVKTRDARLRNTAAGRRRGRPTVGVGPCSRSSSSDAELAPTAVFVNGRPPEDWSAASMVRCHAGEKSRNHNRNA
jgi:hypothetical protein